MTSDIANDPWRRRSLATVGLVLLFVIGWLVVSTVIIVNRQVLDPDTYTSALVRTDAYERTYTEVLADPELAGLQEQLLGRLGLSSSTSAQARTLANNALRWAVPPSTLRAGTEQLVTNVLAYVRGDTDRIDADVAVDSVLDSIDDTAVVEVRTLLASTADRPTSSLDVYRTAVQQFVDRLVAGTLPYSVPVIGGSTFDAEEITGTILDALGPIANDAVRQQVLAAVVAGDQRDALITASGQLVADHAERVADRLRSSEGPRGDLDVVDAIAEHARQPAAKVIGTLDTARQAASWFRPLAGVVGAMLAVGAAAGLFWLYRRSLRRALHILSLTLLLAGVVQLAVWLLAARLVPTPFDEATSTGSSAWNLPRGLRALLADIQETLVGDVSRQAGSIALVMIVLGALLGVVALSGGLRTTPRALAAVGGVAVLLAGGTAVASVTAERATDRRACNGHVELCDRHYDDVVFAATHNSMSSPGVVKVWPEHDGDLRQQLDAGIRTLLIDTHYWPPVRSPADLGDLHQAIDPAEPRLPPAVANTMYPTLGDLWNGRPGSFLCHINCAFGAMAFLDGMIDVRTFLDANPDEVVTLIIQDAISTPRTQAVMHAAGLEPYLYQHRSDHTWPTLDEMIDGGQRLVVFAEEAGPPPDWYANAFEEMQETPYFFPSPERFSCEPNRGVDDAPLFLMNHWIQRIAPDRADATVVNTRDFIVDRARQCERERGLRPNYIAVNFYNIGDVVAAVDELNGLR